MLSWPRGLSTRNMADGFGYDHQDREFLRRLDETEDCCCGDRGRHRWPRALQPAVGEERRRDPRPSRRPDSPLPVERMGPRVLRRRGGRALAPGTRCLRGGFFVRVSEEIPGAI